MKKLITTFLVFLMLQGVCFANVQSVIVDSIGIQSACEAGLNYNQWNDLYMKFVNDVAKYKYEYPNSQYMREVDNLKMAYGLANLGWIQYMKGVDDAHSQEAIQCAIEAAKGFQQALIEKVEANDK